MGTETQLTQQQREDNPASSVAMGPLLVTPWFVLLRLFSAPPHVWGMRNDDSERQTGLVARSPAHREAAAAAQGRAALDVAPPIGSLRAARGHSTE